jgi:hypothetical protein
LTVCNRLTKNAANLGNESFAAFATIKVWKEWLNVAARFHDITLASSEAQVILTKCFILCL